MLILPRIIPPTIVTLRQDMYDVLFWWDDGVWIHRNWLGGSPGWRAGQKRDHRNEDYFIHDDTIQDCLSDYEWLC